MKKNKARFLNRSNWVGPLFLDLENYHECPSKGQIGPNAVAYGNLPNLEVIQNGIGYAGQWQGTLY